MQKICYAVGIVGIIFGVVTIESDSYIPLVTVILGMLIFMVGAYQGVRNEENYRSDYIDLPSRKPKDDGE